MSHYRFWALRWLIGAFTAFATFNACSTSPSGSGTIEVDPSTQFQTMRGWEALAEAFNSEPASDPVFDQIKDQMYDLVVNEAGINRLRLELRAGAENTVDYTAQYLAGAIPRSEWRIHRYATINDNADPNTINPAGFHFSELDDRMTRIVLPIRQRLAANGEALYITVTYVAFTSQITRGSYHQDDPAEYAEFILAAFQHLQSNYGLTPDALEVMLEPDNPSALEWNAQVAGDAIVAVTDRLAASGYTPRIIAPSTVTIGAANEFVDDWAEQGGILNRVHTLAYHRYAGSTQDLQALMQLATTHGKETAMLEWWDAANGYETLHQDLELGNNSAWQQGDLVHDESPMSLYRVNTSASPPVVTITEKTKFTRQYFKFVRQGAVRVGATSPEPHLAPLAFVNTDGTQTVVVKANSGSTLTVSGLAAGTYGIKYATSSEWDVDLSDQTISGGQELSASIPDRGVITIYGR